MGGHVNQLTPTQQLVDEHQVVLEVVGAMEREANGIRSGETVDGERVTRMVEFTREFTDGCHHAKEEKVLFPRLVAATPIAQSPVSVMLSEHDQGRARMRAIMEALPSASAGDANAGRRVADALAGYAELLRAHIGKEDSVLFPLAEQTFDDRAKADLASEFERVEREETGVGVHERYHALAADLAGHGGHGSR